MFRHIDSWRIRWADGSDALLIPKTTNLSSIASTRDDPRSPAALNSKWLDAPHCHASMSGIRDRSVRYGRRLAAREDATFRQGRRVQSLVNPPWDSHACKRRFEPACLLATALDVGPKDR